MTVQNVIVKNIYAGNGSNTSWPYTFACPEKHPEFIKAYIKDPEGNVRQTDDFKVDTSTKTVTYPVTGKVLSAEEKIVIARELPLYQVLNLVNQGPFFAEDVEVTFDELVMMIQQLNEKLERTMSFSIDVDQKAFDPNVPIAAGKTFRINNEGTGFEVTADPEKVYNDCLAISVNVENDAAAAQNAANVAVVSKDVVEDIAGNYSVAKDALENVVVYKNQAQTAATVATTKADEVSAKASTVNAVASEVTTAANTAISAANEAKRYRDEANAIATPDGLAALVAKNSDAISDTNAALYSVITKNYIHLVGTKLEKKYISWRPSVDTINNTNYYVMEYDVVGGKEYKIDAFCTNENYFYLMKDSSGTIVQKSLPNNSGGDKNIVGETVKMHENATKLYVASALFAYAQPAKAEEYQDVTVNGMEKVNDITMTIGATEFVNALDEEGAYLSWNKYQGAIANSNFHVLTCDVEAGVEYLFKCSNLVDNYLYAFYDAAGDYIDGEATPEINVVYYKKVKAPKSAKTLKVNYLFSNLHGAGWIEKVTFKVPNSYRWDNLTWVVLGDSLTADNEASTKHYMDFISDRTGINVVNMGMGGTGYKKQEEENNAFYQRALDIPACDVITIFGSGNDPYNTVLGEYTDRDTTTVCGCVNKTLDVIFATHPTAHVGIVAPTPWANYPTTATNSTRERYVDALSKIAQYRGVPFLDLHHHSGLRPEDVTQANIYYSNEVIDGYSMAVHPNIKGQKFLYPKFLEFIKGMISQ